MLFVHLACEITNDYHNNNINLYTFMYIVWSVICDRLRLVCAWWDEYLWTCHMRIALWKCINDINMCICISLFCCCCIFVLFNIFVLLLYRFRLYLWLLLYVVQTWTTSKLCKILHFFISMFVLIWCIVIVILIFLFFLFVLTYMDLCSFTFVFLTREDNICFCFRWTFFWFVRQSICLRVGLSVGF